MKRGDYIDFALSARGKHKPFQWEAALPEGLRCRPWGALHGVGASIVPGQHAVNLQVSDQQGNQASKTIPLSVEELPPVPAGFVPVPGGPFPIGYHRSQARDGWITQTHLIALEQVVEDWPAQVIHLDGFYMQKYEVTNREYQEFVNNTGHSPPGHWDGNRPPAGAENHPVVEVSYKDAQAYCAWQNEKAKAAQMRLEFALPTHWEWEKAAKGPATAEGNSGRIFPWGDVWGDGMLHDLNSEVFGTVDVTLHGDASSAYGVCDLAGNVSEWVDGGEIKNHRVWKHIRGASWRKNGKLYGLTFFSGRELVDPEITRDDIGFRCVARPLPVRKPAQAMVPLGNDAGGFLDGQGRQQFLGQFFMARFAVSNDEFAAFSPNHQFEPSARWRPVVNVSLTDALAFCQWKSAQDGVNCHLPSRSKWELACRGLTGRKYAWGNEYLRYLCNSIESGWGRTVDVWDLWDGASPDGIYNLCGNTFEWLSNGEAVGGSWQSTCKGYGAPPYDSDRSATDHKGQSDIGFRYVIV
jgi:formylglycine-generating enzyme required for sulfatase activity